MQLNAVTRLDREPSSTRGAAPLSTFGSDRDTHENVRVRREDGNPRSRPALERQVNLLLSTYWTMGAVRHGDYIAKVRVVPVKEFADRVNRRGLDLKSATEVFGPALVAELKEYPYEFDIQVQLCADLSHMPVEDVTVVWPESLSPFVTVAKFRLPQQDIGGPDNFEHADATSMTAWRVTEAHRPLGNIMRMRKEVYRQSSIERHQLNHQVRKEPHNVAEAFGEVGEPVAH